MEHCHSPPRFQGDHRVAVKRDVVADLLEAPMDQEVADRVDDRTETSIAEAGCHADHVLLGDTHVQESLRVTHLYGLDEIDAHVASHEEDRRIVGHSRLESVEDPASHSALLGRAAIAAAKLLSSRDR